MNSKISRRRFLETTALLGGAGLLGASSAAFGLGSHGQLIVTPFNYDPYDLGLTSATFINREGFLMLQLVKTGPTDDPKYPLGNASGATITTRQGVHTDTVGDIHVSQLGFMITEDSQDGGGAPRFNVYDNQGNYWFFGFDYCQQYGTTTYIPNTNLKRISVNPANIPYGVSASNPPTTPVFTNSTVVTEIDIIFDVGTDYGKGFADICRIQVNNAYASFNMYSLYEMLRRPHHQA